MSKNELKEMLAEEGYAMEVKNNILTITIDLSREGEESTSGKSINIATSHGFAKITGSEASISFNCIKKNKAKSKEKKIS
jgi:hypothetical protein